MPKLEVIKPTETTRYLYGLRVWKSGGKIHLGDEKTRIVCPEGSSIERFFQRYWD